MRRVGDAGGAMYDSYAAEFAAHAQASAYNALYDRPTVLGLVGDVRGIDVLDAGCGPGIYAAELVRRGANVTAFDPSAEMVRLATERLGDSASVRQASLDEPLAWLPDASQDLVVMALVIHHVEDRVGALRELARVLRDDGHVVLSTVHPTEDWLRLGGSYFASEPVEERWHGGAWPVRYWRQPLDAWCAEFFEAGFLIERLVEHRPAPEMAESSPEAYERLTRAPGFVAFRLLKRATGGA
jgi:SAM-dependent methyltransferase